MYPLPLSGRLRNCSKEISSLTTGFQGFRLCFMALTTIFSTLSALMLFLSENRVVKKENSSMPTSVTFSAIHSTRSIILVGAMARWMCPHQGAGCGMR